MSTQFVEGQPQPRAGTTEQEKKAVEAAGAGATTEAIGAAAAIVLAIIALAGILQLPLMAIATIVLGVAILMDAASVGARYSRLLRASWTGEGHLARTELGGGVSAGALAGIAGIVLGILALLGLSPVALCAVALIVFGGGLLFGSAAKGRLASLGTTHYGVSAHTGRLIDETIGLSSGGEVFMGIGAVVLGILSLLGLDPVILVLVGYLGVGAAVLLSGSAFGARMFGILRHAI
jgi:hypothetical protein